MSSEEADVNVKDLLQHAGEITQQWGDSRRQALQRLILKMWIKMVAYYARQGVTANDAREASLTRAQLANALEVPGFGRSLQRKQWEAFVRITRAYLDK